MEGEITVIDRIIDENEVIRCYRTIIEFKEKPPFRLGKVEVKQ